MQSPPHSPHYYRIHCVSGRQGQGSGWGMKGAGRHSLCLALWGLPSLSRFHSSQRGIWPHTLVQFPLGQPKFGFPLFVVKNYLRLPLSWSVCPTLLHCWWALAQGPSLGDIWGKLLSRPKVEGMCKLNGWPRWSSA